MKLGALILAGVSAICLWSQAPAVLRFGLGGVGANGWVRGSGSVVISAPSGDIVARTIISPVYYADSVNGSAGNDCLAPTRACATLAQLSTADTSSGINHHWCLVPGSHFRETMTPPRNGMTIDNCGLSGANPIIDGSDVISAGAWTLTSGQTSTYQASLPEDPSAYLPRPFEAGAVMALQTSIANVEANAGSFFYTGTNPITLYIHPAAGGNPGSNGITYEYANRFYAFNSQAVTGLLVQNLVTQRESGNQGSFRIGSSSTANNVSALDGSFHNFFFTGGDMINNATATGAIVKSGDSGTLFVAFQQDGAGMNSTCNNCRATMPVYTASEYGFYAHTNGSDFGTLTYNNAVVSNVFYGFSGDNATVAIINPTGTGLNIATSLNKVSTITGGSLTSTGDTILLTTGQTITITGTTMSAGSSAKILHGFTAGSTTSVTMTNCIVTGTPQGIAQAETSGYTFNLNHNVYSAGTNLFWYSTSGGVTITLTSDYNRFPSNTPFWAVNGLGSKFTLAAWQTTGFDIHSTP